MKFRVGTGSEWSKAFIVISAWAVFLNVTCGGFLHWNPNNTPIAMGILLLSMIAHGVYTLRDRFPESGN